MYLLSADSQRRLRLSLNSISVLLFFLVAVSSSRAQSSEDSAVPRAGTLQAFLDQTHVGGYGEMTYKNYQGGALPRFNIPRFVIYLDHYFSDRWSFKSETEIEDVLIERGEGGEIGLEQAFLDYHANPHINWRGGLVLIPLGIINQTHEPNTFYSVERPLFDQEVIPTTWREIGTGIYGDITEGIKYQLLLTEGLKAEGLTMEGTDGGKQEGSAGEATSDEIAGSDASHPAVTVKFDFLPTAGLRIGAALYYQSCAFDTLPVGSSGTFFMAVFDARYEYGPLRIRAEGGKFDVAPGGSGFYSTPSSAMGGYGELAYNICPLFAQSESELLPFVRYESFTFAGPDESTDANAEAGASVAHNSITAGIAFKPLDNLILKADYRMTKIDGEPDRNQLSVGAGFAF